MTPTAFDRASFVDQHAEDLNRLAWWLARRYGADPDDARQDLAVICLTFGHTHDPAKCRFMLWAFRRWLRHGTRRGRPAVSIEAAYPDGNPLEVSDPGAVEPGDAAAAAEERERVRDAVAGLPPREAGVVTDRYGLAGGEARDLGAIAAGLGVSRERAGQLAARGLTRLRASLGG